MVKVNQAGVRKFFISAFEKSVMAHYIAGPADYQNVYRLAGDVIDYLLKNGALEKAIEQFDEDMMGENKNMKFDKDISYQRSKALREAVASIKLQEAEYKMPKPEVPDEPKEPKVKEDSKTENKAFQKAYSIQDVKITTGTLEEYSSGECKGVMSEDIATARSIANVLYDPDANIFVKEIKIITNHCNPDKYGNPYYNDLIEVKMSNGKNLTIEAQRGYATYNSTIKIRKFCVYEGKKVLHENVSTDNYQSYLTHIKKLIR